jgi:hypothetical protein
MIQKFSIPKAEYVVFQLVSLDSSTTVTVIDTIYLALLPNNFGYGLQSRDSIVKTHSQVFTNAVDYAPEKVRISGTFGQRPRYMAGTYMDGWSRLKQFEDTIVRKSKTRDGDTHYAINYYDYVFQRFGSINIGDWSIDGNADSNAQLVPYALNFVITGDLILVDNTDPLLYMLQKVYSPVDGIYKSIVAAADSLAASLAIVSIAAEIVEIASVLTEPLAQVTSLIVDVQGAKISPALKGIG